MVRADNVPLVPTPTDQIYLQIEIPCPFQYMRDTLIEYARHIIIPLDNRVGQYVRLQLVFDSKWMMISEVQFDSGKK